MGVTFLKPEGLELALTHRSRAARNNERLEFLGDSLLNWTVTELLYERFPKATEGQLTRLRAFLVNEAQLAMIAQRFDLSQEILVGTGERKSGGFLRDSILADAVEAIMGALYLDQGLLVAQHCIRAWLAPALADLSLETLSKDPKTALQEFLQARGHPLPQYELLSLEGPPHAQLITVSGSVTLLAQIFKAQASSKRIAEQKVAAQILEVLRAGAEHVRRD